MMEEIVVFDSIARARKIIPDGEKRLVKIGTRRICLINIENLFYAVDDGCPHLGHSLSKGTLNPFSEIICPWHAYRFNLKTGEEAETRCKDLKTYQVKATDQLVIVIE